MISITIVAQAENNKITKKKKQQQKLKSLDEYQQSNYLNNSKKLKSLDEYHKIMSKQSY